MTYNYVTMCYNNSAQMYDHMNYSNMIISIHDIAGGLVLKRKLGHLQLDCLLNRHSGKK